MPAATIAVLDVDGSYVPVAEESVHSAGDVGMAVPQLHLAAAGLPHDVLVASLQPALIRSIQSAVPDASATILVLSAGVLLLRAPTQMLEGAEQHGLCLIARSAEPLPDDGLWPGPADTARVGAFATSMVALRGPQRGLLELWEGARQRPPATHTRWLDDAAARVRHHLLHDPAVLLSPWNLTREHRFDGGSGLLLDGRPVSGLDLSAMDPDRPWLLDAAAPLEPRGRLSDHPNLASAVRRLVTELADDPEDGSPPRGWDMTSTNLGIPVDGPIRELYRPVATGVAQVPLTPDPFDPAAADALRAWLTGARPTPYLLAVRRVRPDLRRAFPNVPGRDTRRLLRWAQRHGRQEGLPAELLGLPAGGTPAPRRRRPPTVANRRPGATVVGYLRGELGVGESARLMVTALQAAGVPHATLPVDHGLTSRQRPPEGAQTPKPRFATSLICVNADLTPPVVAQARAALTGSYRIGMWYWEVEDFPPAQHGGFAHVDEVWVATEFIRGAIEPHAPVPVRTITPPLPQRGPDPTLTRADVGLPESTVFLFSFDFLSTAERKNPWGLIDAFRRAFRPGEGPVLVIKSINARERPADAERLRLAAAGHPHVVLREDYLEPAGRDALVAHCDCYVSLHRSEGLGLTMAEAMTWGKPVIATGYGGNLQFMTERNSFLVPWTPATIPADAAPYPADGTWAEPDLDAAARAMREVLERPDIAAARGAQAARDIAALHSPQAAGARIAARLADIYERPRGNLPARTLRVAQDLVHRMRGQW